MEVMMMRRRRRQRLELVLGFLTLVIFCLGAESQCTEECDALASYYVGEESDPAIVASFMSSSDALIQRYNRDLMPNLDFVLSGTRLNVPFRCGCVHGELMGHQFVYNLTDGDVYLTVAETYYSNLTTVDLLQRFNDYNPNDLPPNSPLNVTVLCSCGNSSVSKEFGLFITYPLRPGENLSSIAAASHVSEQILQGYNPNSDFTSGSGFVFVPGKDQNGNFPPLESSSRGISGEVIAGVSVAAVAGFLFLAGILYFRLFHRKKAVKGTLHNAEFDGSGSVERTSELVGGASAGLTGITVKKSVEFSYEELAKATTGFSLANKIGQGGFGAVYYAELRGEKAAIKMMDMKASKEFLAELKVLTHLHHLNLVRLIGYCVEGSLFLVYEFIENGNLSEHLRRTERDALPWSTRVQIALDSARGLEYIHEHTLPSYIHGDIKSANILIDTNYRAKVADFGLAKLTGVGSGIMHSRVMGTFGYMPPECAHGDVSQKMDVYAFGVVLYELISAKDAIIKTNEFVTECTGLVALFEDVLSQPDPAEELRKLVDPRLLDDYPHDSVLKMARIAKACTHENPQRRPSMRSIVVALMMLSSPTGDWDIDSFYANQGLVNLMSGR